MFWKKKRARQKLQLGVSVQRCSECTQLPLRPCLVDGEPRWFHRWVDDDQALLQVGFFVKKEVWEEMLRRFHEDGVVPPGATVEMRRRTMALMECPDGSVYLVSPERIEFIDREG